MITYLIDNNILGITILLNTVTAYILLGFLEDIIVPWCENLISKQECDILISRFIVKILIWHQLIRICFLTTIHPVLQFFYLSLL